MGDIKLRKEEVVAIYESIRRKECSWPGTWEDCDCITSYDNSKPVRMFLKFKNNKNEKWELEAKYKSIYLMLDLLTHKCNIELSDKMFTSFDPDLGWGVTTFGEKVSKDFETFPDALTYIYNYMLNN